MMVAAAALAVAALALVVTLTRPAPQPDRYPLACEQQFTASNGVSRADVDPV
jgi:hypothetical protein